MSRTLERPRTTSDLTSKRSFHARRWGAVAAALAVVVTFAVVAFVSSGKSSALAQVLVREGKVTIDRAGKGPLRARDGSDLVAGDSVKTSDDGQGVIDFRDGSVTRLDSATQVTARSLDHTRIVLGLEGGRIWNHVDDSSVTGDRFEVRLSKAAVSSGGSTFLADCRQSASCYVVSFDGTTHVSSRASGDIDLTSGECEQIAGDGSLETCDPNNLGLIDEWVKANLAEDQQLVVESPSPAPSPSPSPAAETSSGRSFVPSRRPVARPVRTPSKTTAPSSPGPTKDPNNDGVFPTPPPKPRHTPRVSSNV